MLKVYELMMIILDFGIKLITKSNFMQT